MTLLLHLLCSGTTNDSLLRPIFSQWFISPNHHHHCVCVCIYVWCVCVSVCVEVCVSVSVSMRVRMYVCGQ